MSLSLPKIFISILLTIAVPICCDDRYTADLNGIIDEITSNIAKSGKEVGLEPLQIPDIHQDKKGEIINLTEGELTNVISIKRFANAIATYADGKLNVETGCQFTDLEANFNFDMKVWGMNPNGRLKAVIPDLIVYVEVVLNPINLTGSINRLVIPSVGDIKVSMNTTAPIYGKFVEGLITSFTVFFQDEIVYIVGKVLEHKINELIEQFSKLVS